MRLGFGLGLQYSKLSGGGGGIDPQAQAQITRITNAGGTIEDTSVINADIKFLKSIGLFANLKYAVDPRAGITQRVDGSDTFASKIFDYSGSDADTDNLQGSEQPKKGILNGVTSLDFDGVNDKLTNEDTVTFLAGEEMFSIAVYAQDFDNSGRFGMVVDKLSPDNGGQEFGRNSSNIVIFANFGQYTTYQNVQIIASGTTNTSNLLKGFINGIEQVSSSSSSEYIGKSIGKIRKQVSGFHAKAQFQKNWDFNALPTESQASAIYAYLQNQFNITF